MKRQYKVKAIVDINIVMPFILRKEKFLYKNFVCNTHTVRVQTFTLSIICQHCGIEGKYFKIENCYTDKNVQPHLNLYAVVNGEEIQMTSDHIIPISRGGNKYRIENRQCLCTICNSKKDNKLESELEVINGNNVK